MGLFIQYVILDMTIEFVDKEITAWGGLVFLKKMLDRMGFEDQLNKCPLPKQGSNRGYAPNQLVQQFMASVWCGANRYSHLEVMRFDPTVQKLFGWGAMAGHKAFVRYFGKFTEQDNYNVFNKLHSWFFGSMKLDNYTLDIDSSVMTRYGAQAGAAKGYNTKKPGRKSHHPLLAFVSDLDMVANFWLRSGDAYTANNFKAFLETTLDNLNNKKVGLLRMDSGFYSRANFEYLESNAQVGAYIIAAPMYVTLQREIQKQKNWVTLAEGEEIAETLYQSPNWDRGRRLVMVRQKVSARPNATGKSLSLFDGMEEVNGYRYACYITDLSLPAAQVWRLYRGRANAENRIKELKYDYGLDKINQESFEGTEATLNFLMVAFNIMNLFKNQVIDEKIKNRLSTLRYKMLAIPSYLETVNDVIVLKMALQMQRRAWIEKLWANSTNYNFCSSA